MMAVSNLLLGERLALICVNDDFCELTIRIRGVRAVVEGEEPCGFCLLVSFSATSFSPRRAARRWNEPSARLRTSGTLWIAALLQLHLASTAAGSVGADEAHQRADRGQQAKSSEDQGGESASEGASGASHPTRSTTGACHEHRSAVARGTPPDTAGALHGARPAAEPARGGTLFGELLGQSTARYGLSRFHAQ